jgi:F-type H+-transporting ATPase subunit b
MLIATLLEPVAEKSQPLIDIDWTVFIQFGIFLVMAGVLYSMVFKPYLRNLEERTRRIDGAKADARSMQERASAIIADYEQKLIRAKQRGAEERLKLRAEGQAYEREVLGRARAIGQKALEEARQRAESQREAARKQLAVETQVTASRIAARVLGREVA